MKKDIPKKFQEIYKHANLISSTIFKNSLPLIGKRYAGDKDVNT